MTDDKKWLETLKEGDSLFLETGGFGNNTYHPDKVKRITKTMIILEKSSSRFRMNGGEIGKFRWDHGAWLHPDNDHFRELFWMQEHRNKLQLVIRDFNTRLNLNRLSHEQLERLLPALTAIRDEIIPKKTVVTNA